MYSDFETVEDHSENESMITLRSFPDTIELFDNYINDNKSGSCKPMEVASELNSFFKDSVCEEVIITENTDKLFFGIKVYPVFTDQFEWINSILTDVKARRIDRYVVEIDTQIFNYRYTENNLNSINILALLINEVSSLVNTTTAIDKTKDAINEYLAKNNTTIIISKVAQYQELLAFALKDAISKFASIFYTNMNEVFFAGEFIRNCGLGDEIDNAVKAIKNLNLVGNKNIGRLIVMEWALRLYNDVKFKRIDALETIRVCTAFTGSALEKRHLNHIAREIKTIDDGLLLTEFGESIKEIIHKIRKHGVANIEKDLYEYAIQVNAVDTEDDARILMREINNRMAILLDYIEHEEIPENERDRWRTIYDKYEALREKLMKKPIAKFKYMQLWVENNPNTLM